MKSVSGMSVCLSVYMCVFRVICECENWALCCAALGEVKLHSGTSMGATKLHSSSWIAVFYNQALVIPTPLERLYELPLSLPWYAKPYPAKTQMAGLTKDTKHTYMKTLKGYVTLPFQRTGVFWGFLEPQFSSFFFFLNRGLRISCFLSSFVCSCSVVTWLPYANNDLMPSWDKEEASSFSNIIILLSRLMKRRSEMLHLSSDLT